jgi:hypothetical protein
LDDYRGNHRRQADRRSSCNVAARITVFVLALVFLANLHLGSAQAAGGLGPGDLSTQVQGIVDSALGAAQQPSDAGSVAADDIVTQAVTLAQNAVAGASSTAATLAPQSTDAELPISQAPAESARERTPPARPRPAPARKHRHAAVPPSQIRGVVSNAWYDRSSLIAVGPSPIVRARTAKAPPRPERSATPRWPRPRGPMPPRPDVSSAGQGGVGGQGTSVPSLLAALAGLLFIFGFHRLPRLLPLLAFRKPRRIVLPSWHPG